MHILIALLLLALAGSIGVVLLTVWLIKRGQWHEARQFHNPFQQHLVRACLVVFAAWVVCVMAYMLLPGAWSMAINIVYLAVFVGVCRFVYRRVRCPHCGRSLLTRINELSRADLITLCCDHCRKELLRRAHGIPGREEGNRC